MRIAGEPPLRAATARRFLADVIDLYDRGRCEPLPLFVKTSGTYAQKRQSKSMEQAHAAAAKDWETSYGNRFDNEDRDLEHQLVFGRVRSYADLLLEPPAADERGDGWIADETTRFGRLARRLWDPLLAAETVKTS
jgi:exodeoxyribonuclease V gamma subunit